MWLRVALIVSLLGGAWGAVWQYDRNAKLVGELRQAHLQCEADLVTTTTKIGGLNQRIREENDRKLAELAKADAQVAQANEAAAQARQDRAAAQEEVRRAQERYRELLANDPELQAYSRAPGWPDAVRDRLRVANGEAVRNQ